MYISASSSPHGFAHGASYVIVPVLLFAVCSFPLSWSASACLSEAASFGVKGRNPVGLLGCPVRSPASPHPKDVWFVLFPILCSYRPSCREVRDGRRPVVSPCPLPSLCFVLKAVMSQGWLQGLGAWGRKDRSPQSVWGAPPRAAVLECCRKGAGRGWP